MYKSLPEEKPTTELFIGTVISRETCRIHGRDFGEACYSIPGGHPSGYYSGVCNARAKRAGFNHAISEKSLRLNRRFPKKR